MGGLNPTDEISQSSQKSFLIKFEFWWWAALDFSYLDQRMKQIDRSVRPEYTATYRLLKNGKLYGYRVEYSAIDAIDNPHQYDLSREQFNDFVARKIVRFVKMTSNGPTGYSGFELKKLPSINLDNKFRFEALLKA